MVKSHSNKLHHLEGNSCISSNVFRAQSRSIGLRVVKSQEVYCVVSTLHNAGPFNRSRKNLECFSTILCPDRTPCDNPNNSRRTNSIYFFDTGAESSRRDGWTDKWMYVAHTVLSSIRGCVKDSRSPLESSNALVERGSIFFFSLLVPLSFRLFRRSYILFFFSTLSTEHDCAPRAVTLGTRRPLHNLEIYFQLQGILQMYRTSRIDENKAKILGLGFWNKIWKIFLNLSAFRLKNKWKVRLFDVWFCCCKAIAVILK